MTELYGIGEMIIDFIPYGGRVNYIRKEGGAPASMAIASIPTRVQIEVYTREESRA